SLTLDEGLVVPQHVVNAPNLDRHFPTGMTGADLVQGPTPGVRCVAFAPDGRTVATAGADCAIQLWDTATGRQRGSPAGHPGTVHAIIFAPGGRSLASASADGTVRIWDLTTQRERVTLSGHGGPVYSVKYAPDGQALATAGADGRVRIWDVATAAP